MDAVIVDKYGNWYSSKDAALLPDGRVVAKHSGNHHSHHKRYRASAVVIHDNKLLLVRDNGKPDFSLPGGGFEHGETTIQAGIREVAGEELGGIQVLSAERLPKHWDLDGKRAYHKFVRLTIQGEPYIKQPEEINKVIWWDMKSPLPVQGHVKYILSRIRNL